MLSDNILCTTMLNYPQMYGNWISIKEWQSECKVVKGCELKSIEVSTSSEGYQRSENVMGCTVFVRRYCYWKSSSILESLQSVWKYMRFILIYICSLDPSKAAAVQHGAWVSNPGPSYLYLNVSWSKHWAKLFIMSKYGPHILSVQNINIHAHI